MQSDEVDVEVVHCRLASEQEHCGDVATVEMSPGCGAGYKVLLTFYCWRAAAQLQNGYLHLRL